MTIFGYKPSPWQLFAVSLVFVLVIALPSLLYPFGRDQGIHAYTGAAILNGNLPYRDVFVQKGPYGFLIHSLVTALAGPTTWGIHLFDLVWQILGYGFLFAIARRRLSLGLSLLVVLLTAFSYHAAGFWHTAHHEGYLTPPLLFAIWSFERFLAGDNKPWAFALLSGAAVAATFWFKQTAAVYALALSLWLLIELIRRRELRPVWPFAGGLSLVLIGTVVVLLAAGMFIPMLAIYEYTFFGYPSLTADKTLGQTFSLFSRWWNEFALVTYPATIGFLLALISKKRREMWYGLLIVTIASILGVYLQGKFWHYHWVSTLPFLALFSGLLFDELRIRLPKTLFLVLLPIALVLLGRPLVKLSAENFTYAYDVIAGRPLDPSVITYWRDLSSDMPDRIAALTREDDPIFVWGHYSILYYFSERANPTAYPMDTPLSVPGKYQRKWQADAIEDLRANPPQLILLATVDANDFEPLASIDQLPDFPAFEEMLASDYLFDFTMGEFEVYVRQEVLKETINIRFDDQVTLKDSSLRRQLVEPGGELILSLHWMPGGSIDKDYTVFVQLYDPLRGQVIAQNDSQPGSGRFPTSSWQPGDSIWDTHIVGLPAELMPGTYELILGLYDADTLERLPITGQDRDYYTAAKIVIE